MHIMTYDDIYKIGIVGARGKTGKFMVGMGKFLLWNSYLFIFIPDYPPGMWIPLGNDF